MNGRDLVFIGQGMTLVKLDYSVERSDHTRALYYITGGLLLRQDAGPSGRLEFRTLPVTGLALAAIHDFEPALPWGIYAQTQAPVHEFVMKRFQSYLKDYTAKRSARENLRIAALPERPKSKAKIPFSKALNSKWTALLPVNGEKHFLVTRIADNKRREVKLECVVTKRSSVIAYANLTNGKNYTPGWR
jgi:tryptophan-rich hypothetical protein